MYIDKGGIYMSKKQTKKATKFYRAGKLRKPGTKITLKTRPFVSGALFDTEDPITSFHLHLINMKTVLAQYQEIVKVKGLQQVLKETYQFDIISDEYLEMLNHMVDYLTQAPIEILLKPQEIDSEIISAIARKERKR